MVIANCDDVLVASAAYDAPNVVWVAAGGGWAGDSASCPRSGEPIVWEDRTGDSTGYRHWSDRTFAGPPRLVGRRRHLYGPDGLELPMTLTLPGKANRGNAAQAVAAAVALGADPAEAVAARRLGPTRSPAATAPSRSVPHSVRMLLAKNPAGWQEALSMIDPTVDGLVIAVNGQVPDGEDLSWLWDVRFEHFEGVQVVAAGERGTDLARPPHLRRCRAHAGAGSVARHRLLPARAVEVLANYTAFRDLNTRIAKGAACLSRPSGSDWCCPMSWAPTATAATR